MTTFILVALIVSSTELYLIAFAAVLPLLR